MRSGRQRGAVFLLVLVSIAVVGVVSAASIQLGATQARREAEEQLLVAGLAFEQALQSYRAETPATDVHRSPKELKDLLRDPRHPGIRRHLRAIPVDPITGKEQWRLLREPGNGIVGVSSTSTDRPVRSMGFTGTWIAFNEARSYADWVFGAPQAPTVPAPLSR